MDLQHLPEKDRKEMIQLIEAKQVIITIILIIYRVNSLYNFMGSCLGNALTIVLIVLTVIHW